MEKPVSLVQYNSHGVAEEIVLPPAHIRWRRGGESAPKISVRAHFDARHHRCGCGGVDDQQSPVFFDDAERPQIDRQRRREYRRGGAKEYGAAYCASTGGLHRQRLRKVAPRHGDQMPIAINRSRYFRNE